MPTKIEWAEETWNPITGCDPISEGCANCYARRMATRLRGRYGYPADDPFRVTFHPERLSQPERWKKPRMIFVCSMGDLFHEHIDNEWIKRIFGEIAMSNYHKRGHTFMVLTKRPERLLENDFEEDADPDNGDYCCDTAPLYKHLPWPKNLFLGVSAENRQRAEERIPILLQIPAAVRFVSVEPMLGPVDLTRISVPTGGMQVVGPPSFRHIDALTGYEYILDHKLRGAGTKRHQPIDWVFCGGESGPGARPMRPDWARSLRDQCVDAGVPFFFKQWGQYCYPDQMPGCHRW